MILRVLRRLISAIGVLLMFVIGLVSGALLALDTPVARRFAMKQLNGILGTQFKGKISVDRLAHLSIFGVRGVDATVTAADGTRVVTGRGVAARISPFKIIKSALFGKGDIRIGVEELSVDSVDADLDTEQDGSLRLVNAFDPAKASPPSPPGARGIAIALESIAVTHIWAHGTMAAAPPIDADVDSLRGSFLSTSTVTKLDVEHLSLRARGLPRGITANAEVDAHLMMPSAPRASMAVRGKLTGTIGEIPVTASVAMDGDAVDGVLDVPEVTPEMVQASVEQAPVYESVSVHAEAHGELATLKVQLAANLGRGKVTLDGILHAKGALGGEVTLAASHIDARTFSKGGPTTDVGLRIEAKADTRTDGVIVAEAAADIPQGTAAGQSVPSATFRVAATERPGKDGSPMTIGGHLEGIVSEPGAPLAVTADGTSHDGHATVTFGAKADVPRLTEVKRIGNVGSGSAQLTLTGHAAIGAQTSFDAELIGVAHQLDRPGTHVDALSVGAKAHGTPANPEIEALIVASGVVVPGYKFSRAEVEIAGTRERGRVAIAAAGRTSVTLKGDVALAPALVVSGLAVGVKRETESVTVGVESARVEGETIDAKGIVLTGAGDPLRASFHKAPGYLAVSAASHGLDLGKLAFVVGQDKKASGTVSLDVDLDARRDRAKGKVALDLTKGEWSDMHGAEAHVGLSIDGRHLTGKVHGGLGDVGTFDVSELDVEVGGQGALNVAAWRNAWGKMTFAANVDMARVAALAPPGSLHVADVAGRVALEGTIARDSLSDTTPEVRLSVTTSGLAATGESTAPVREPGGPLMVGPATWTLQGIDGRADLIIDGADSAGEIALRVVDKEGALVSLDVKTDPLPFKELLSGEGDIVALMEKLPVSVRVDVPTRELSALPLLIRPDGVRGGLAATVTMTGNALSPVIDIAATSQNLVVAAAPDTPMDGALNAHYDGANARVNVGVNTAAQPLLTAQLDLHANAKDIVLAKGLPAEWGGGVTAKLARFPLGALGPLSDNQVKGFVSGDLAVTGLHDNAKATVNLALDQLQMGRAKFTKAIAAGTIDEKGLSAKVRLEDPKGFLEADATMGMKWGSAIVPVADGTGVQAKLSAKHFSAAAVAPFASSALSELSGWVDADASIALVPGQKPKMSGSVSFTDGIVQAPAIGEEFHAVKAKVTLNEDGIVKLDGVEARGLSGRLTATGSAHLDGTTLVGADLALDIKKADAIPLDIQGSNLGTVYGDVTVKATGTPDGKVLKVAVAVPHFHVDLPSGSLPRSPQGLADAPSVHMGVYTGRDRFLVLPVDNAPVTLVAERNVAVAPIPPAGGVGTPVLAAPPAAQAEAEKAAPPSTEIDATIHIGDVQILRGQQMAINLDGDLSAKVAAATTVRGEIHLKSGKLNVQSKEFEIEKGTISFVGNDPSNPEVTVTAGWTAPDGTKVLADYVGPVKTGKVNLRSEPPRPKNEIVQLILFGTADGSESTPYASKSPSTGTQAGTAVGGLATDGLSKGIDQLTGMNVTTKIDTSDSSNPKADVEFQVAKDISLQLAYVIVQPPPGDNPDLVYATIDWRFVRNWSLETTFGDAGSTFADMVWQYRY